MNAFLVMVEVVVKSVVGVVCGAGVGTLVFGIGLVMLGVADFRSPGPPPAPIFIGLGAGLLTTALTMTGLFVGPLSRWRWIAAVESHDQLPRKWKTAG